MIWEWENAVYVVYVGWVGAKRKPTISLYGL